MEFNPNVAATGDSGVFGLPFSTQDAALVLIPVPWEATTSYGGGTSGGPDAILEASKQVDLFDLEVEKPYTPGIAMVDEADAVLAWNEEGKQLAQSIIEKGGDIKGDATLEKALARVNKLSDSVNDWVESETTKWLTQNKIVGLVGGDHSVPYGAMKAIGKKQGNYGILHFDAHSDTRDAYEGFNHSHASIFRNVLNDIPQVTRVVQVGIRDLCEEEMNYVAQQGGRVTTYSDIALQRRKMGGENWLAIGKEIVDGLPDKVWVSFDIDGLDPKLCPNTGTPVPGGLEFLEAVMLIGQVARSGRRIIGFDLSEVSPGEDEWDANVGARLLYKLCAWTFASQKLCQIR